MVLLSQMSLFHFGTSRFVPATSQMGQSFLGTKQTILLLIKKKKIWAESYSLEHLMLVSLNYVGVVTSQFRLSASWCISTTS